MRWNYPPNKEIPMKARFSTSFFRTHRIYKGPGARAGHFPSFF